MFIVSLLIFHPLKSGSASLGYLSLVLVLRFFKERTILISGLVIELFMSILLLALMGIVTFRVSWFIPLGVVGLVLFSAVLSYIMATASSILADRLATPCSRSQAFISFRMTKQCIMKSGLTLKRLNTGYYKHFIT